MRQPLTRLNLGSYGHCSCTNRCAPPDASTVPPSSKEDPSLAIEAWQRGYCAQTFARREIECDHFVLGYAVKPSIQPQAARLPESGPAIVVGSHARDLTDRLSQQRLFLRGIWLHFWRAHAALCRGNPPAGEQLLPLYREA